MPRQAELSALLREVGALMDGHFLLSSGRHSPAYVEKFRLLQHPPPTERLCRLIADRFRDDAPELLAGARPCPRVWRPPAGGVFSLAAGVQAGGGSPGGVRGGGRGAGGEPMGVG